jgi:hypothetical protein
MESALITLDEVTEFFLDQFDYIPESRYDKVSRLAIRGFRLFHRDSTGIPKTVTIPVQANNTAVLPSDCLTKIAIGVLNQRGEIASLTEDSLLSLTKDESSQRLKQPTDHTLIDNTDMIINFTENLNTTYPFLGYGQYGLGATGTLGFYRIDWGHRVIIFNFGFCQQEIIFEYLATPNCEDGNFMINALYQEALIAFIAWQYSVGDKKASRAERLDNKRDYDVAYANARRAAHPFDPSNVYNQYRQGVRLSPKA